MSRPITERIGRGHWGIYDLGTSLDRYRYCYACKEWRRNPLLVNNKPLIHKGRKS